MLFSISVPVKKSFSRLLFHLEAVRLSPSFLTQRKFTANFDSDDDYVQFPSSSIFPGSSLAGLEVCSWAMLVPVHASYCYYLLFYNQFLVCRCALHWVGGGETSSRTHTKQQGRHSTNTKYCDCTWLLCRCSLLVFEASQPRPKV